MTRQSCVLLLVVAGFGCGGSAQAVAENATETRSAIDKVFYCSLQTPEQPGEDGAETLAYGELKFTESPAGDTFDVQITQNRYRGQGLWNFETASFEKSGPKSNRTVKASFAASPDDRPVTPMALSVAGSKGRYTGTFEYEWNGVDRTDEALCTDLDAVGLFEVALDMREDFPDRLTRRVTAAKLPSAVKKAIANAAEQDEPYGGASAKKSYEAVYATETLREANALPFGYAVIYVGEVKYETGEVESVTTIRGFDLEGTLLGERSGPPGEWY